MVSLHAQSGRTSLQHAAGRPAAAWGAPTSAAGGELGVKHGVSRSPLVSSQKALTSRLVAAECSLEGQAFIETASLAEVGEHGGADGGAVDALAERRRPGDCDMPPPSLHA